MSKNKCKNIHTYVVISPDGEPRLFETTDSIEEVLEENFAANDFDDEEEFLVFESKAARVFHPQRACFTEEE